jgi:signal transduction histidine kinase
MTTWVLDATVVVVAIIVALSLFVAVLVLMIAWLRARSRARRLYFDRTAADRQRIDLELSLAEQTGRLRIVRELHEVSVNALSVIISQADGAQYASTVDPSAAVRSTAVIAESARATLGDLRRVMALVREGEANAAPHPRLASTHELFTVMRDSGLNVVFEEFGSPFDLKNGAELAVYRILQEALANTLNYGGPGTEVRVSFTWGEDGLQVRVDDDGIRASARREGLDPNASSAVAYTIDDDLAALTVEPTGRGISEMRSRAEVYGGILTASTVPGVGFSLSAVFPALRFDGGNAEAKLSRS